MGDFLGVKVEGRFSKKILIFPASKVLLTVLTIKTKHLFFFISFPNEILDYRSVCSDLGSLFDDKFI